MTKAAFSCWDDRIAPVFDTARELCVVETQSGSIVRETWEKMEVDQPLRTILRMAGLQLDVLVCGAISGHIKGLVEAYGISVVPFVTGDVRRIIGAWLEGNLETDTFAMPGCGFQRRRRNRRGSGTGIRRRGCFIPR